MNRTAVFKIVDFGSLKALASVIIDGSLEIRGFKILEQSAALWVAGPSREGLRGNGCKEYIDIVRFTGDDADAKKREFHNWLIEEYKKVIEPEVVKPVKKTRKKKAVAKPEPATKEE